MPFRSLKFVKSVRRVDLRRRRSKDVYLLKDIYVDKLL